MKRLLYIIISSVAILICSCEKELDYSGEYDGEKLVLMSVASPGKKLTAKVFKTEYIYQRHSAQIRSGLSGAHIIAIVNGKDTYPFHEITSEYEVGSTEYWRNGSTKSIDYVSEYLPKIGDHIVVKASFEGFEDVQGETIVPERPRVKINSCVLEADEEKNTQFKCRYSITIDDPAKETNYYSINIGEKYYDYSLIDYQQIPTSFYISWRDLFSRDIVFYNASLTGIYDTLGDNESRVPSVFDDGRFNGLSHTFILTGKIDFYGESEEYEHIMDNYLLAVDNLSESLYMYMKTVESIRHFEATSNGLAGEAVILCSNIENGLGCVGAISGIEISLEQFNPATQVQE